MLREWTVSWKSALATYWDSVSEHTQRQKERKKEEREGGRRGETIHFILEHFGSLSTFNSARKSPKCQLFPIGHEFLVASWPLHIGAMSHVAWVELLLSSVYNNKYQESASVCVSGKTFHGHQCILLSSPPWEIWRLLKSHRAVAQGKTRVWINKKIRESKLLERIQMSNV